MQDRRLEGDSAKEQPREHGQHQLAGRCLGLGRSRDRISHQPRPNARARRTTGSGRRALERIRWTGPGARHGRGQAARPQAKKDGPRLPRGQVEGEWHEQRAVPGKDTQHRHQIGGDPIGAHDPLVVKRIRLIPDVGPGTQHTEKGRLGGHSETQGDECSQADHDRSC